MLGMRVSVVGPPAMIPREIEAMGVGVDYDLEKLAEADVVYLLRIQQERMAEGANFIPSLREYTAMYGISRARLRKGQKVMHPGPINRGVEISAEIADDEDTLITQQVESGLAVRMAILYRTIVGFSESDAQEAV